MNIMNRFLSKFFAPALLLIMAATAIFAQNANNSIEKVNLSQSEIDRIVQTFTNHEGSFRDALTQYAFNRNATIQTIGLGGQVTGTFVRNSFMTIGSDGNRFEKILYAPMSTLTEISVSPEDIEDLGGTNPFALEPSMISQYNFNLLGKEKIDDLNLYVFDVAPKVMPKSDGKLRYFIGKVWVDDRDLMIVKSKGKAIPETKKQKFPVVETWRENIDGKYWFPAFTSSDDELVFNNGQVVKLRVRVNYTNYRQGKTDVIILDDDQVVEPAAPPVKKP